MHKIVFPALLLCSAVSMLLPAPAMAQSAQLEPIRVLDAWARATVPKQVVGAVYLQLENQGKTADTLLRVETDSANSVELHTMLMQNDVMRMRELESLPLPAASKLVMQPGHGPHLMLVGLKQALQAGQSVNLTLVFAKAGKIKFKAKVMPFGAK